MRSPSLCVILGAPRSGTTWVQRLLAGSPDVAAPQETTLFHRYLDPQWRHWERQTSHLQTILGNLGGGGDADGRVVGLPTILDSADLVAAQRALLGGVLARAIEAKPSARVVVEKTPSNSLCVDTIDRVRPDAQFVHIVRDPRDVMASLRDAAGSWGARWAPDSAQGAARVWLEHFRGARQAERFGPRRYMEIRYEDLRADPRGGVARLVEHLGLADDPDELIRADAAADTMSFDKLYAFHPRVAAELATLPGAEPAGFRSGGRRRLSAVAMQAADSVLGRVAREAGYTEGWPDVPLPARYALSVGARAQAGVAGARRLTGRLRAGAVRHDRV